MMEGSISTVTTALGLRTRLVPLACAPHQPRRTRSPSGAENWPRAPTKIAGWCRGRRARPISTGITRAALTAIRDRKVQRRHRSRRRRGRAPSAPALRFGIGKPGAGKGREVGPAFDPAERRHEELSGVEQHKAVGLPPAVVPGRADRVSFGVEHRIDGDDVHAGAEVGHRHLDRQVLENVPVDGCERHIGGDEAVDIDVDVAPRVGPRRCRRHQGRAWPRHRHPE